MKDRVNKKRPEKYTLTSNKILQDSRLSYEAIGKKELLDFIFFVYENFFVQKWSR